MNKIVSLKWELEIKNFTKLRKSLESTMINPLDEKDHCKLCVLAAGEWMCMYREICRIPQDEVYINKKLSLIK